MNRPVQRLADDVPAGHFKPAYDPLDRGIGTMGEARSVRLSPEMLNPVGWHALEIALKHVFGHAADNRREAGGVNLANASDSAGCCQPYENEIPPAKARWWCADDEGFQ